MDAPEELVLLVLDEAERQLSNPNCRQGKWDEFIERVGRSPSGVMRMERCLKIYSEDEQRKYRAVKHWKPEENG